MDDHTEVFDTMDWTLELAFLEKIDDVQGRYIYKTL